MNKGFTLVELIVSIVIIMVMMGIGSVSINNFAATKKLEGAAIELTDQIKLAKNMAITGQLPSGGSGLVYVKVTIVADGTVKATDNNNNAYFNKKIDSLNGFNLGGSSFSGGIGSFGFASGTGRLTEIDGTFANGSKTVIVTGSTGSKTITITDLGMINEN
jgi:prepilin-type N-terminal cleavage/methylation domain-containing protein